MNNAEFQLRGVGDPRLAVHATSALAVWLWSIDGTRILWANPVGARLFARDRWFTISQSHASNRRWRVHLDGVDDRTAAERLTGAVLHAEPIDDPDELWVHQLIGATVVETDGTRESRTWSARTPRGPTSVPTTRSTCGAR